jgi:hypothetical protein
MTNSISYRLVDLVWVNRMYNKYEYESDKNCFYKLTEAMSNCPKQWMWGAGWRMCKNLK